MAIHALTRRRATCDFPFELWDFSLIRPVGVGVALGTVCVKRLPTAVGLKPHGLWFVPSPRIGARLGAVHWEITRKREVLRDE